MDELWLKDATHVLFTFDQHPMCRLHRQGVNSEHESPRLRNISLKPFWLSVFCVLLLSFESNGQGDEEGWRHEGHEEGDEEGGSASCGQASCEAQEGHEEGDEGSEESEEGLNELSMTPLEGQPLFKAVGSPCPT